MVEFAILYCYPADSGIFEYCQVKMRGEEDDKEDDGVEGRGGA